MSTTAPLRESLTRQELRVLQIAAPGLSNSEIAAELWLTEQTIKFHMTRVMRKLGTSNRTAAIWRALELGLLESPTQAEPELVLVRCPFCEKRFDFDGAQA